jgi:hypothetical protein
MYEFPEIRNVFKSDELQAEFQKNGYVIVDFYTPEEIKEAEDLYFRIHPSDAKGFVPGTYSHDKEFRDEMDRELKRIGNRSIEHYLTDIKVVCASFIVKTPGPESGMSIHQDMTLVDESRFTGINIWVPLVDLSVENGALFILPGSHRFFPTYRGSSIAEFFSGVMDEMLDYLHPVTIKAGKAVIFDQSIIHFSPPNYSDKIRIVTNTYFTHKDAEFRTFWWNESLGNKHVEAFAQDNNFMLDYDQFGTDIRQRPRVGRSLGLVPYDFPKIDKAWLESRLEKTNARQLVAAAVPEHLRKAQQVNEPRKGIIQRIKELVLS